MTEARKAATAEANRMAAFAGTSGDDKSASSTAQNPIGRELRRVIPLPTDRGNTVPPLPDLFDIEEPTAQAIEKVLLWRTATPEPLDTQWSREGRPARTLLAGGESQSGLCDCVSLVTYEDVSTDIRKPVFADIQTNDRNSEAYRTIVDSPTLYHLWNGYRNYLARNDGGSTGSEDVHTLAAYSCRSARSKVYNAYKSIVCTGQRSVVAESSGGESKIYRLMAFINQYMNVFSALADFNYAWLPPAIKGGICNAMVVDKVFAYNDKRKLHVPSYRLLEEDLFTDFVVSELRKIDNRGTRIEHIRFLSTVKTLLYTNRTTLARLADLQGRRVSSRPDTDSTEDQQHRLRSDRPSTSADLADPATAPLPLKKRLVENEAVDPTSGGYREQPHIGPYLPACNATWMYEPSATTDWLNLKHQTGCSRGNVYEQVRTERPVPTDTCSCHKRTEPTLEGEDSNEPSRTGDATVKKVAKNPTLVVFKHSFNNSEPDTLLCNIIAELHLSDKIRY